MITLLESPGKSVILQYESARPLISVPLIFCGEKYQTQKDEKGLLCESIHLVFLIELDVWKELGNIEINLSRVNSFQT